jgi:hypothetical protein
MMVAHSVVCSLTFTMLLLQYSTSPIFKKKCMVVAPWHCRYVGRRHGMRPGSQFQPAGIPGRSVIPAGFPVGLYLGTQSFFLCGDNWSLYCQDLPLPQHRWLIISNQRYLTVGSRMMFVHIHRAHVFLEDGDWNIAAIAWFYPYWTGWGS